MFVDIYNIETKSIIIHVMITWYISMLKLPKYNYTLSTLTVFILYILFIQYVAAPKQDDLSVTGICFDK